MGFRDDNNALRARIQTLESEKEQLREEKSSLENALAEKEEAKSTTPEPPKDIVPSSSVVSSRDAILEHMSKRKAQEQAEKEKARSAANAKRAKVVARLQRRKARVRIQSTPDGIAVHVEPGTAVDQLRQQLPWGFGFAFVNPGVFIMMGLAALFAFRFDMDFPAVMLAPIATWALLLTLINVAYAKWKTPPYRLEVTGKHFALFKRGDKPVLFGTLGELKVSAPDPDPLSLHRVRVSDGRKDEAIDFLLAEDVVALESVLLKPKRAKKKKAK